MSQIRFDKLSMYDRDGEPVSLAVPFAKGQLQDLEAFGIVNGEAIAVQKAVTSTWEDGSVKWTRRAILHGEPKGIWVPGESGVLSLGG